jgi:hypothetical protein
MSVAYKLKADASFPRPIRQVRRMDGVTFWETEGILYEAGAQLTEDDLTENDKARAANGELDHLLERVGESVSVEAVEEETPQQEVEVPEEEEVVEEEPVSEEAEASDEENPFLKKTPAKATRAKK